MCPHRRPQGPRARTQRRVGRRLRGRETRRTALARLETTRTRRGGGFQSSAAYKMIAPPQRDEKHSRIVRRLYCNLNEKPTLERTPAARNRTGQRPRRSDTRRRETEPMV